MGSYVWASTGVALTPSEADMYVGLWSLQTWADKLRPVAVTYRGLPEKYKEDLKKKIKWVKDHAKRYPKDRISRGAEMQLIQKLNESGRFSTDYLTLLQVTDIMSTNIVVYEENA